MKNLFGNYQHTLDEKGRLTIPSKFRNVFGEKVFITINFENTIVLRTEEGFNVWVESLQAKSSLDSNVRNLRRMIFGNTFEVDFDKQGRVLLPEDLISRTGIKKNVQVVGVGDEVELFSSEAWEKLQKESREGLLEKVANEIND